MTRWVKRPGGSILSCGAPYFKRANDRSQWMVLLECVATLNQFKRPYEIHEAFSNRDDHEATALHTTAWKAPPKLALLMLDLIPLDERVDFSIIKHVLVMAPEALEWETPRVFRPCTFSFPRFSI
jgi:hypothetical protein